MNKLITIALVAGVLFVFLAGCQSVATGGSQGSDDTNSCLCEAGKSGDNVWCAACNVGYIDGEKVECKGCYDGKVAGKVCVDTK